MPTPFDPGYGNEPFRSLCASFPGPDVYPPADFRVEWGPIFHRGRLDGTARVLVIGQDPAVHETVVRRILVGVAGARIQGFLKRLNAGAAYVMVNTYLYSVYGQQGGERHADDPAINAYREQWLDAILASSHIAAIVSLGHLADQAYTGWRKRTGARYHGAYAHITHPTQPESAAAGNAAKLASLTKQLLVNWNAALDQLGGPLGVPHPAHYGDSFAPADLVQVPPEDIPAGLPDWMRRADKWGDRTGATALLKRRTITITVPSDVVP
ncbi:MAG: Uracil-DNA glycosylase superfamily [Candidatus Eremiobacteraeota bacterium]|nr:Uracil-DNA glycosylase superfamily [Candidatus Eremiobacteraeota bacterium]